MLAIRTPHINRREIEAQPWHSTYELFPPDKPGQTVLYIMSPLTTGGPMTLLGLNSTPRHLRFLIPSWFWLLDSWLWLSTSILWWLSTSSASSITKVKMTTSRIWSVTTWWQWVPRPWPHGLSGRGRPKESSVLERWGWCNGVITLWEPRGTSPSLTLGWGLDTPGVSTSEFHGSTAFVFISENWEWSSEDQRSLFQPFIWLLSKQIPKGMTQQDKACLSSVGDPVRPCRNERHSSGGHML